MRLHRFALAALAAASLSVSLGQAASAQDISAARAARTSTAVSYNWTGFYVGANAGYGWNRNSVAATGDDPNSGPGNLLLSCIFAGPAGCSWGPAANSQPLYADGFFGGGQIGYNWQFGKTWVAGLEADIQSGFKADASTTGIVAAFSTNFSFNSAQQLKWFGTVRGRLGILTDATERFQFFGTAGLAYGQTNVSANVLNINSGNSNFGSGVFINCTASGLICLAGSDDKISIGWTAGAGAEWAAWNNVSLKAEYLHVDLGVQTIRMVTVSPAIGNGFIMASFKNSYDLVRAGLNVRF